MDTLSSAWAELAAMFGTTPGALASGTVSGVVVVAVASALSGGSAPKDAPPSKERQAELDKLRNGRAKSRRILVNPTTFQKATGALVAALFASLYIVAPLWLLASVYLVVTHTFEVWAWIIIAPVAVSAIVPPIASKSLMVWMFQCVPAYFDAEVVEEISAEDLHALDSKRALLMAMQPHGVITFGGMCGAVAWAREGSFFDPATMPTAAANVVMRTPLLKHIAGVFGMVDASSRTMTKHLNAGNNCALYIGGIAELFLSSPKEERLFLRKRKGFIKLALRTGAEVLPVYYFGNSVGLKVATNKYIREFGRMIGVSLTPMWGRYGTLIPFQVKVVSVLGKPIGLPKIEEPTKEDVDKWHKVYEDEVKRIFDTYKDLSPQYANKELAFE